jgi:hypothetical protein
MTARSVFALGALVALGTWLAATGCYRSQDTGGVIPGGDVDGDSDSDGDTDTDSDSDSDSDSDTDVDCGFLDDACCDDGTCADEGAVCAEIDTYGEPMCMTACAPDTCAVEGYEGIACVSLIGPTEALGFCYVVEDVENVLPDDNACDSAAYGGGWYCCPPSMGGDPGAYGEDGDLGTDASFCGGVDLSALAQPEEYAEAAASGVGICLTDGAGNELCAPACTFDNTCDVLHTCVSTELSDSLEGVCRPY